MNRGEAQVERVALVSGANRGLGLAIADGLARRGFSVWLTARDEDQARAAAAPILAAGARVRAHQLDVTRQESVDALLRDLKAEAGRLDVLVNNAGVALDGPRGRASSIDLAAVSAALEVNLIGAWRLCQASVPLMQAGKHGRIVNLSSDMGSFHEAGADYPSYRVSKAALNMLTVVLAAELRHTGILVNAVCPGWVRTAMGGSEAPLSAEEGADTPLWLATLPDDGPSGGFFQRRRQIPW